MEYRTEEANWQRHVTAVQQHFNKWMRKKTCISKNVPFRKR